MGQDDVQHGSSEPVGQGRTYFNSMDGDTPRASPRGASTRRVRPRARSTGATAEQDYEDDARREERQESRRGDPVGMNFRVNALEQSLRSHTNELLAQKLMVQQLAEAAQGLGVGKENTESRLNEVFGLVHQRFTEAQNGAQEIRDVANKRFD